MLIGADSDEKHYCVPRCTENVNILSGGKEGISPLLFCATSAHNHEVTMFLPPRDDDQEWFGVLVAIPEPWVSALTQARIDLGDELGARVPAHITLMPPVPVPKEARTEVIRHLRDVAQRHAPFRISLKGSGTFLPISPVAFVNVDEGAAACTNLAEDIRSGPLDHPARFPYHPHVTLAQGVSEDVIARALHLARGFEASWLVPGFRLDQVDERGTYHSQALFDFEASTTGMDAPTKRTRSKKSRDNK